MRVEVAAAFSSKSQTGSMIAHLRLTGSETTLPTAGLLVVERCDARSAVVDDLH
ncbi:hypothetical protein [Brevundimonas sp. PWP3-1b1]|uniref:hypothetical protein n=1 Tax=unclassified Brevundimonas TaxID=2622653 RepID=UPI003CF261AE